jgi:hypothetical protein
VPLVMAGSLWSQTERENGDSLPNFRWGWWKFASDKLNFPS